MRSPIASLLFASCAIACATAGPPEGYEDAVREARRNWEDPGYGSYHRALSRELRGPVGRLSRSCRWYSLETRGAVLLYRLDDSGQPLETIAYPESDFSECMHAGLDQSDFPPPPHADYWLGLFLRTCPQGGGAAQCRSLSP